MFRLVVFVPLIALLIGVADVSDGYACSGYSTPTLESLLEQVDYVVSAEVVQTDDLGQNAVIRIDNYIAGGQGPQYILLNQRRATTLEEIESGVRYQCLYLEEPFELGDSFYLFINHGNTGSYNAIGNPIGGSLRLQFPESDSVVNLILEPDIQVEINETEFLDLVREISGETPVPPDTSLPFPLISPLKITTTTGTNYQFPVDRQQLTIIEPCANEFCQVTSPNGLHNISVSENGTIILPRSIVDSERIPIQVDAYIFSPIDSIAIWIDSTLQIHGLGSPRFGQNQWVAFLVDEVTLTNPPEYAIGQGAWSPDGRIFTYSDSNGLWLWDVFNSEPRLLLPSENDVVPIARYFSPMGRYLAITRDDSRENYDLIAQEFLPDGIISPDDRSLFNFDTAGNPQVPRTCSLAPYNCSPIID